MREAEKTCNPLQAKKACIKLASYCKLSLIILFKCRLQARASWPKPGGFHAPIWLQVTAKKALALSAPSASSALRLYRVCARGIALLLRGAGSSSLCLRRDVGSQAIGNTRRPPRCQLRSFYHRPHLRPTDTLPPPHPPRPQLASLDPPPHGLHADLQRKRYILHAHQVWWQSNRSRLTLFHCQHRVACCNTHTSIFYH